MYEVKNIVLGDAGNLFECRLTAEFPGDYPSRSVLYSGSLECGRWLADCIEEAGHEVSREV